jgi:hypothetical protein
MLYRDTHVSRQLADERHAELKQNWRPEDAAAPAPLENRRDRPARRAWLRAHLRSVRRTPARHAS